MRKKLTQAQRKKRRENQKRYRDTPPYGNVYEIARKYQGDNAPKKRGVRPKIPEDRRATEEQVDILIAGRKRFKFTFPDVTRLTGITYTRLRGIFEKRVFCSLDEYALINKAAGWLVVHDKRYNSGKNPQRK